MKFTSFAVTMLAAVAGVTLANDYQPAFRALAASEPAASNVAALPAEHNAQVPAGTNMASANEAANAAKSGDKKEWWGGGYGWGGPWGWGGYGRWGGYGGWGRCGGWGGCGGWGW